MYNRGDRICDTSEFKRATEYVSRGKLFSAHPVSLGELHDLIVLQDDGSVVRTRRVCLKGGAMFWSNVDLIR